ncbi:phosphatase PAP2 family protein [Shinella sp. NM-101]|uniref:phosphatase PAP2 family protein n=1 Tax=Shinella sp. NM-101 TaxID=2744455 RepID=UPI001F45D1AF|nr:phosphatase PAP2 family protein [Shinella sp. NM-101]
MRNAFLKTLSADLRQMLPFHAFVLAHAALVIGILTWHADFTATAYRQYAAQFGPVYFLGLPAILLLDKLVTGVFRNPKAPLAWMTLPTPALLGHLAGAAAVFGSFILFMGSFTTFKTLMPAMRGGFPYDRAQADLDALLFGGVDPGPRLMALFGNPHILSILEWNYSVAWTAFAFVPIFFIVLRARGAVRLRYCLGFALVWAVLGNLLAYAFLSAGPAFYGYVTGDAARFGAQLRMLDNGVAATFQAYLWQNYLQDVAGLGTGISAFPSVHVGVTMMNALFLREFSRTAGLLAFAYVFVTLVSSTLLGWHYLIDGYTSILVVLVLHIALKRLFAAGSAAPVEDLKPSPNLARP